MVGALSWCIGDPVESTREELNDALWNYCARVDEIISEDVESFLESPQTG